MKLELISFKICPFVQRAVMTLMHNNMPYEISYIDLADPPSWFKAISPFGKVPVLKVDDSNVIFESAVIDEFLNDVAAGQLLPDEPLQRALDRSWIEFGTSLTLDFSGLIHSTDEQGFEAKLASLEKQFNLLEEHIGKGPYFDGGTYSLVDIAYAPLFMRAELLNLGPILYPPSNYPKIRAWADTLLALPHLSESVVSDFEALFTSHIRAKAPYTAQRLGL